MITPRWFFTLLATSALAGCSNNVASYQGFGGDNDPVARAIGNPQVEPAEARTCDVGIALRRRADLSGLRAPEDSHSACVAFSKNGVIVQVSSLSINEVPLPWIDSSGGYLAQYTYGKFDTSVYGPLDSMAFTYRGFDGESFASTVDVAPSFGRISAPDTIYASKGCTIKYGHCTKVDNITVEIGGLSLTLPDTGTITIRPNLLSYDSVRDGLGYSIWLSRSHWATRMSPAGNRVGIFSLMECGTGSIAKP